MVSSILPKKLMKIISLISALVVETKNNNKDPLLRYKNRPYLLRPLVIHCIVRRVQLCKEGLEEGFFGP